jgi:hypothetical protein
MCSRLRMLLCCVFAPSVSVVLLLLMSLAPFSCSVTGAEQAFELVTQEEFNRLIVEAEQRSRRYRERRELGLDVDTEDKTWKSPQERVNAFRHGIATRAAYRVDRPYRLVPPELSSKSQEILKRQLATIRARSWKHIEFAVDAKSIYELRSQGLSYFFPDWVFVEIPVLRAPARPEQPRDIVYGVLPESYTYAFREADGEVFGLAEGEWFDGFGEFAKKCGVSVKGRRDAGLLWNAYAALCHEQPAFIEVRELKRGVWNVTSQSWKGTSLDIIADTDGRLREFIRKKPGAPNDRPEVP